jgi:hypothetical protein
MGKWRYGKRRIYAPPPLPKKWLQLKGPQTCHWGIFDITWNGSVEG